MHTAFPHQNSIHSIHPRTKGKENLGELDKNRDIFLHRLAIRGEDEASVFVTEKKKKEKEKMDKMVSKKDLVKFNPPRCWIKQSLNTQAGMCNKITMRKLVTVKKL